MSREMTTYLIRMWLTVNGSLVRTLKENERFVVFNLEHIVTVKTSMHILYRHKELAIVRENNILKYDNL